MFVGPDGKEHSTLYTGDITNPKNTPIVRIHSECLTGDAFGSLKCDCGPQLQAAMCKIQEEGCGAIVCARKGVASASTQKFSPLQDQGHDTLDANLLLGLPADGRTYDVAAEMLKDLGVGKIRLMTNNPLKINGLKENGIDVEQRLEHIAGVSNFNSQYLATKGARMGHLLDLD